MNEKATIRPMNKSELANCYGVSRTTLMKWLIPFQKRIGQYVARCYTVKQIKIIYECLGEP